MLISKTVITKWNGMTRKWYEDKGYIWTKQNDLLEVKVEDLHPGSVVKILVDCDYKKEGCRGIHEKEYRQYIEDVTRGYGNCCNNKKCGAAKTKEILLDEYGVDNIQKLEKYKIQSRERQRKPFQFIIDKAKNKKHILLTTEDEYKNKKSEIRFICKKHSEYGEQSTSAGNFLKNKTCCEYGRRELCSEIRKLDGNMVYQEFINEGLIPKFNPEDYNRNNQSLPYLCPNHLDKGVQYRNYANLKTSKFKCQHCFNEYLSELHRTEENIVFDYFKRRGLTVLKGEKYRNKDQTINYYCDKHVGYIQKISYSGLENTKQPCEFCRIENSVSKLNRLLRSVLSSWKKESEKYCNYECIFTGLKKYDIHHLISFNSIVKEAISALEYEIKEKYTSEEITNIKDKVVELHRKYPLGVCISNSIHILFHQLYSKDTTIQDFEDFKQRYYLGEFENILKEIS